MSSFFTRLKAGLARTAQQIRERLGEPGAPDSDDQSGEAKTGGAGSTPAAKTGEAGFGAVKAKRAVAVETFDAVEDALLGADVGLAATERIVEAVKQERQGTIRERVARVITRVLTDVPQAPAIGVRPHVVLVVGVNGTGKTTSIGKLARYYQAEGRSVLVCAADTFRAAAVEQLSVWAERVGVDVIRAQPGADPAAVTFDAVSAARARGRDIVLVDTAGRLHTRTNLMAELDKIRRVVGREVPGAPHEVLLVLDATVGQNGLVQAREFMAASGANGIVLTKLDGTAKGGVAIAIAHELKLPIRFVGVGEGVDDLLPFDAEAYVDAIFSEKW
ncbi:MAG TPA: signal recognition particle-docking protein FtsY [Vicinamibacterales bacterium]|nr:signal recognition particle-docking protein FtsY [Vicinamibacterales bacterium]